MVYGILADAVVALHLAFVAFAVFGGLLCLWRRRMAWVHLPLAAWAAAVELMDWFCPLTPLENRLRRLAGQVDYEDAFVERYLLPILYPTALTREMQLALGLFVIALNVAIYGWIFRRRRRSGDAADAERR